MRCILCQLDQRVTLTLSEMLRDFKVRTLLRALGWGPISLNVRPKSDRGEAA